MADLGLDASPTPIEVVDDTSGFELGITSERAALVEDADHLTATYSAAALGIVAALTPTDIFTIYGSATKTIKILRIGVSGTENTAAIRDIVLIKRSATNTGGTSSAVTKVPLDSNDAAATATVLSYSANPTALGAAVGNIRVAKLDIPATNLTGTADRIEWTFGDRPGKSIVLRSASEGVAVNLNGVTASTNSFNIDVEWTEE